MTTSDTSKHKECVQRFIELANAMKDEGIGTNVVSAGLMTASGVYATFIVSGNEGGLTGSGIDKVAAVYKRELEQIQQIKKQGSAQ